MTPEKGREEKERLLKERADSRAGKRVAADEAKKPAADEAKKPKKPSKRADLTFVALTRAEIPPTKKLKPAPPTDLEILSSPVKTGWFVSAKEHTE